MEYLAKYVLMVRNGLVVWQVGVERQAKAFSMTVRIGILTVSDRASRGEYADEGGPAIRTYLAEVLASTWEAQERIVPDDLEAIAGAAAEDRLRRGFARFLNRLLFCLVRPADRWKIFQRFYRVLPEERIARFYAHRFTFTDAARIVIGWPPSGLAPIRFARSFVSLPGPVAT